VISASWDGSKQMTEEYVLLRALFGAAREESILAGRDGYRFYSLSSLCTKESFVMTEYEGRDGTKIRAESSGDRTESGALQCQKFVFVATV